ncbi:MAG: M48 family metalloprotease [Bacteroidales bacterium]|nr:M48 family metalloprotease [Bacteroidales bacterium]
MYLKLKIVVVVFVSVFVFWSCDEDGTLNLFTVQDDIDFGEQFHLEIEQNSEQFPILSPAAFPEAYDHIERIRDELVASDDLRYANDFDWDIYIIDDDETLNAFCVPGGKMYFYTGIIKFLDNEAQLAGVMAHEMAHADRRHSTKTMTKAYGFSILLSALLGDDPALMAEIAADLALGLGELKFSRDHEYEADEYAVRYTADANGDQNYFPKGISAFFEKISGHSTTIEFLSTHPDPGNRLENIDEFWNSIGSPEGEEYSSRYEDFKNSLP